MVAARKDPQTVVRSRLAARRVDAGLTQVELATAVGLSVSQLRRLERGRHPNPGIALLARCAIALGCEIEDLIEPAWRVWRDP